jgi:hypothetical protein
MLASIVLSVALTRMSSGDGAAGAGADVCGVGRGVAAGVAPCCALRVAHAIKQKMNAAAPQVILVAYLTLVPFKIVSNGL